MDLYFLSLHGIRGESFAPRHIGEIELITLQWGGFHGPVGTAAAVGPGKMNVKDLTFTKSRDRVSPILFHASTTGRHIREAVMTAERVNSKGHLVKAIVFQLTLVLIDSVRSLDGQVDVVTLSFGGLQMRHA